MLECLKIVNNEMKMIMKCVSSHQYFGSLCGQEKGVQAKGIYFPR